MICLSSGGSLALLEIIIQTELPDVVNTLLNSTNVRPETYWMLSTFSLIICTVSAELSKTIYHLKRLRLIKAETLIFRLHVFFTHAVEY